jgi:hypothetical protein
LKSSPTLKLNRNFPKLSNGFKREPFGPLMNSSTPTTNKSNRSRQSPASHHFIYQEFRRANLKRFQYHVIYRVNINTLFIIAFAHAKRHPDYWKSRIPEDPA